jgi:uncharacterized iron-regulated protein
MRRPSHRPVRSIAALLETGAVLLGDKHDHVAIGDVPHEPFDVFAERKQLAAVVIHLLENDDVPATH